MGRFMKPGKVVLVLGGRYAGRKAVIVKVSLVACNLKQFFHGCEGNFASSAGCVLLIVPLLYIFKCRVFLNASSATLLH